MGNSISNGVKYGAFAGLISVLLTVVLYVINPSLLLSWTAMLLGFVFSIVFMFLACSATKKSHSGYLSFGQGFLAALTTMIVAALLGNLFTYVLYNFIDPGLVGMLKEYTIETTISMMESFGMGQEPIDQAIEELQSQDFNFGVSMILQGLLISSLFGAIPSAIVGAIMQKKRRDPFAR